MDEYEKRKNILDLQFQKYLLIASTSIVIIFTYFIGLSIALFSEQLKIGNLISLISIFIISFGILGFCSVLFFNALYHIRNIPLIIKDL